MSKLCCLILSFLPVLILEASTPSAFVQKVEFPSSSNLITLSIDSVEILETSESSTLNYLELPVGSYRGTTHEKAESIVLNKTLLHPGGKMTLEFNRDFRMKPGTKIQKGGELLVKTKSDVSRVVIENSTSLVLHNIDSPENIVIEILQNPTQGFAYFDDGQLTYIPNFDFVDTDRLVYRAFNTETSTYGNQGEIIFVKRDVNQRPVITSTTLGFEVTVGIPFVYELTVNDPDDSNNGEEITWSLSSAPEGMTISSTGVLSWDSPVEGVYDLAVYAADGGEDDVLPAEQFFFLQVVPPPLAPPLNVEQATELENFSQQSPADSEELKGTLESLSFLSETILDEDQVDDFLAGVDQLVTSSALFTENEVFLLLELIENIVNDDGGYVSAPLESTQIKQLTEALGELILFDQLTTFHLEQAHQIIDAILVQKINFPENGRTTVEANRAIATFIEETLSQLSNSLTLDEVMIFKGDYLKLGLARKNMAGSDEVTLGTDELGISIQFPVQDYGVEDAIIEFYESGLNPFKSEQDELDLEDGSNFLSIKLKDTSDNEVPIQDLVSPITVSLDVKTSKFASGVLPLAVYYDEELGFWSRAGLSKSTLIAEHTLSFTTDHLTVFTVSEAAATDWKTTSITIPYSTQGNTTGYRLVRSDDRWQADFFGTAWGSYRGVMLFDLRNQDFTGSEINTATINYSMSSRYYDNSQYVIDSVSVGAEGTLLNFNNGTRLGSTPTITLQDDGEDRSEDVRQLLVDRMSGAGNVWLGLRTRRISGSVGWGRNPTVTFDVSYNNRPTLGPVSMFWDGSDNLSISSGNFEFQDADDIDTLFSVRFVTAPSNGNLYLGDELVEATSEISGNTIDVNVLTYRPNLNYSGLDQFIYQVNDGLHWSTGNSSFSVNILNSRPIADTQSLSVNEDESLSITLTGDDANEDSLTYIVETFPSNGLLSGNAPNLIYQPNGDYHGSDNFTFKVNDGSLDSETVRVDISVDSVNDVPLANTASLSLSEDESISFSLSGIDVDGDSLTYLVESPPSHGSLTGAAPNLTYRPSGNYHGSDNFTFKVNDGSLDSETVRVDISVESVNDAPLANAVSLSLDEDDSIAFSLSGTDVDGDSLTYLVESSPSHGSLSGDAPNLTYRPSGNYHGSDNFTFKVNDGSLDSETVRVDISVDSVNDVPLANASSLSLDEDESISFSLSGTDVDGDSLTYLVESSPSHGSLTGEAPDLTYHPSGNYHGSDNFTFKVTDGSLDSETVRVDISVESVNDAPLANASSLSLDEDESISFSLSGTDVDGDSLTYLVESSPSHGSLSGDAPNLIYRPSGNYHGSDNFTFKVTDGSLDSETVRVDISVESVNDVPLANASSLSLDEDESISFSLSGTDVDGDSLTYLVESSPSHGSLTGEAPDLTYRPSGNYHGSDNFTFKVTDGSLDSETVRVDISVESVNDVPLANASSLSLDEDESISFSLTGTDVDGDSLTYLVESSPSHGSLTGEAPDLTYRPSGNYHGSDNFTFKVNDGSLDSETVRVDISVESVNDVPIANAASLSLSEDESLPFILSSSDVDGDSLIYIVETFPSNGILSGDAPNLTYYPSGNYHGPDNFTFKVNDGNIDSQVASVFITVTPVNDVPVAEDISMTLDEDLAVVVQLSGSDIEENNLTFEIVEFANKGSLTLDGNTLEATYIPELNYHGMDSFTYRAYDGLSYSEPATVSLTIQSVYDAPIASDANLILSEDAFIEFRPDVLDVENMGLNFEILESPNYGIVSGDYPELVYTPQPNYFGSDNFLYRVSDQTNSDYSDTAMVTLIIDNINDPPLADPKVASLEEDSSLSITLSGTDLDGDALSFEVVDIPENGVLSGLAPAFVYSPNSGFYGSDNFTYKANDGSLESEVVTVSITVTPKNRAPVANSLNLNLSEDTTLAVELIATDSNGDNLTYTILNAPNSGNLSGQAPSLTYSPYSDFNGADSFTYMVNDGELSSSVANVVLTVEAVNDGPEILSIAPVTALEDQLYTYQAIVFDPDDMNNGTDLTWSLLNAPEGMTVSETGLVSWTPTGEVLNSGNVTLKVKDGGEDGVPSGDEQFQISVIFVNAAPIVKTKALPPTPNNTGAVAFSPSDWIVSENPGKDSESAQVIQYSIISSEPDNFFLNQPQMTEQGLIIFTPKVGANGTATIRILASDNGGTDNGGEDSAEISTTVILYPDIQNFLTTLSSNFEVHSLKVIDFNNDGKADVLFIDEDQNLKILLQDSSDE